MAGFETVEGNLETAVELVEEAAERLDDVDHVIGNVAAGVGADVLHQNVADVADRPDVHLENPAGPGIHFRNLHPQVRHVIIDLGACEGFARDRLPESTFGIGGGNIPGQRILDAVVAGGTASLCKVIVGTLKNIHKFIHRGDRRGKTGLETLDIGFPCGGENVDSLVRTPCRTN
ncbi:hypothetical protein SDC9_175671 [bioreactor metagenome]|uniref:Uncharacterized protein n=1 Tax=bioreactor metagenome TaxID=1076179 RepID=A0A645GPT2_9ZZZZ